MIAHRFVPLLCVLFAGALIPTLIHSYSDDLPRDGRTAAGIATSLAGYSSTPSSRNATWGKRRFDSDDWVERHYTDGKRTVRLTVVRSFDPKSLYHHPELAIAYGNQFSGVDVTRIQKRPDVPIHVLAPMPEENAAAAYVLHYGGRFVEDPIRFQILTAGELLVSRRQAMTIFFAIDDATSGAASRDAVTDLLVAAIDSFLAQDVGTASGSE